LSSLFCTSSTTMYYKKFLVHHCFAHLLLTMQLFCCRECSLHSKTTLFNLIHIPYNTISKKQLLIYSVCLFFIKPFLLE
jgi:hypothetical protein